MKINGLDGFLRSVKNEDARPAPPDPLLKQWRFTSPPALAITNAVADFILLDGHHASIVEGEGFQQLLKLTEPRYVCPSRTYFQHVCATMLRRVFLVSMACLCRRISLRCTTKSNCCLNRLCTMNSPLSTIISHLYLPTKVRFWPAPIHTILFRSRRTCGLAPTMSPTSVLLLTGSLHSGNCNMLCLTSYFALTDTPAKIWLSGSSKYCARMTSAYDFAAVALLAFFLAILSFFAASWCWSSDSWSWRWHIEGSATERYPWLTVLWSWPRSHGQCWHELSHFRSDLHQGFQRGFDNQILQQSLSEVARWSSKEYLSVFFLIPLGFILPVCVVGAVDGFLCPPCSSNAVCAHSMAVKVWDVEIFTCKQRIRKKDVCE